MNRHGWVGVGLGVLTFVVLVASAPQYGLTYDEPVYMSRAMRAGEWLQTLAAAPGEALKQETIDRLWDPAGDEQPGLPKLLAYTAMTAGAPVLPPLTAMRLATLLIVSVLVGFLYAFVARERGRAAGLMAALGLLLMPNVFAHSHLLAMDAPVMAWSFIAVAAVYRYANEPLTGLRGRALPRFHVGNGLGWLVLVGLATGAAVATKVNGLFLPFIILPWLLVYRRRAVLPVLGSMAVLGAVVFVGSWPWMWHDTAARVVRYLAFFGKHYPVAVTYFGHVYDRAPWHFPLVMTLITTPPVVLGLGVVGVLRGRLTPGPSPRGVEGSNGNGQKAPVLVALMVWGFVVNILPSCLPGSPKYNGVRLFLPVFPYLAVLAALGWRVVADWVGTRVTALETWKLRALLLLVGLVPLLMATAYSHPWGMSYYNALIGGPKGAVARGMEATYWGETFAAALPFLNEKAPPEAKVWINVAGFVSTVRMYQSFGMLRPDLELTAGPQGLAEAQLAVVANKPTEWGPEARELVARGQALYTEELSGAPLVWVFSGPFPSVATAVQGRRTQGARPWAISWRASRVLNCSAPTLTAC